METAVIAVMALFYASMPYAECDISKHLAVEHVQRIAAKILADEGVPASNQDIVSLVQAIRNKSAGLCRIVDSKSSYATERIPLPKVR